MLRPEWISVETEQFFEQLVREILNEEKLLQEADPIPMPAV